MVQMMSMQILFLFYLTKLKDLKFYHGILYVPAFPDLKVRPFYLLFEQMRYGCKWWRLHVGASAEIHDKN